MRRSISVTCTTALVRGLEPPLIDGSRIVVHGKPGIPGSSDPAFRGDRARYNPEEMLVASVGRMAREGFRIDGRRVVLGG